MVRIYVYNIELSSIKNKLETFKKFLTKEEEQVHIFSQEYGHYKIEKDKIYLIESAYNENYKQIKYNDYVLLIDSIKDDNIQVVSQLPKDYIYNKRTYLEYKLPLITFIIWGIYDKPKQDHSFSKKTIHNTTKDLEFYPMEFYFECDDKHFNIDNLFFQEEFNRFLSMLN